MKTTGIVLLSIFGLIVAVNGNAVRTVQYQDGNIEGASIEDEEIPPREEWFRVRNPQDPQNRMQSVPNEEQDMVQVPQSRNNHQVQEVTASEPVILETPRRENNQGRKMQVRINSRGRVGLQSRGRKESRQQYFSRSDIDEESDLPPLSRLPSVDQSKPDNWHSHIRHENGQRGRIVDLHQNRNQMEATSPNNSRGQNRLVKISPERNHAVALAVKHPVEEKELLQEENPDDENIVEDVEVVNSNDPPPHEQVAKMARYIVRNSNWTSMATISTMSPVKGYPFANVFSISDGPANESTGIPYMYLTPLDMSVTDLETDSRATLTMSLAQTEYCARHNYDSEDPRCAHVILSGKMVPVTQKDEIVFARNALFAKHPAMSDWPKDHGWFFGKLSIEHIVVLDFFGGAKTVTIDDYYGQSPL